MSSTSAPLSENGAEDREVIRAALRRLPRRQRAVLVLRFFYDLPVEEVGRMLDCSAGTVKSHTSRGLTALRAQLGLRELAGRTPII